MKAWMASGGCDKTGPPGKRPLPGETVRQVVNLTLAAPPGETTHWTGRARAAATGVSLRSVQRIWAAYGLTPTDVQALYGSTLLGEVHGRCWPVCRSTGSCRRAVGRREEPDSEALDRTQPGLPMKKGRAGTMTHDDERHGTTTLFAALNVRHGTVIGRCMQRHRHEEFIRFLNAIERTVPAGKLIRTPSPITTPPISIRRSGVGSTRHPRWTFHFMLISINWANAVENFFATLTKRRLKCGAFCSIVDLQAAINRYLAEHNHKPKPFVWKADPKRVLAAIERGKQALES